ncbi:PadR family transcriptional regulator [Gulosibacter chungangensis]|uniref:PadR family transcriptional regulator n=1 Tax=Gulosibacter chungangensis TaxID=979746 RepID=A0A7J5B9X8_9MICO|nr:PadR family transcriptional regulator [Gulosibacter chungangensis]KAB1642580.1 PadR family transcriptional regulator [Gulosibacter chungangensis]
MKRHPLLPLTETTYYVLLALLQPAHGYLIMSRVEEASLGQVRMAPGTLYGALDNLLKQGLIERAPSEDARRKVYRITKSGFEALSADTQRMAHLINAFTNATQTGDAS